MAFVDTLRYLDLPSAMQVNPHALRVIRERSGLSVSELARQSGLSQPHLSNIEAGKRRASPAAVRRLAEALRVPIPALLADPDAASAVTGQGE